MKMPPLGTVGQRRSSDSGNKIHTVRQAEAHADRIETEADCYMMQKYLLSWHHLTCYVSRLDVSDEYIEQMTSSKHLIRVSPKPVVRRSIFTTLLDNEGRVLIAQILVQMVIEELRQYRRHAKLVKLLTA